MLKKYCKRCKYHIKYSQALSDVDMGEDGKNICAASMVSYVNIIGETALRLYGATHVCEECGTTTSDERKILFKKCVDKNKDFKCETFKPKWYWWIWFIGNKK